MASDNRHIIQKQVLDIGYASKEMEKQLNAKVKTIFTETTIPGLSNLFDRLSPEETLRIPLLEVDLGVLSTKDLETGILENFLNKVERGISAIRADKTIEHEQQVQSISQEDSELELLLHFIETGSLPWWFKSKCLRRAATALTEKTPDFNQILKQQIEQNTPGLSDSLKAILKQETIRKRIVYQFSTQLINELLALVYKPRFSHHFVFFKTVLAEKLTTMVSADPVFKVEQEINLMLIQLVSELTDSTQDKWLAEELTCIVCKHYKLSTTAVIKTLQSPVKAKPNIGQRMFMEAVLASISKTKKQRTKVTDGTGNQPEMKAVLTSISKADKQREKVTDSTRDLPEMKTDMKAEAEAIVRTDQPEQQADVDHDTLYIENAGLVLLAPFLSSFFEQLGLVKNKGFIDEASLFKAIILTQQLSNRQILVEEYMLPLNKILCGLDTETPVNTKLELNKLEQKEADKLLKAVITNWKQLKNTSAEGLQNSFLQRRGSLKKTESGWLLLVERKSIDILLDSLPWSINIIKLPWMKEILHVEW